jgi:hypothetical protein
MKLEEAFELKENFKETLTSMLPENISKQLEVVDVKSYKDNKELKELIDERVPKDKIHLKQCFGNAAVIATFIEEADYVEGYVGLDLGGSILPIEHAWNVYKGGYYFDITSDEIFGGNISQGEKNYAKLITIEDPEKARQLANDVKRATYYIQKGDM